MGRMPDRDEQDRDGTFHLEKPPRPPWPHRPLGDRLPPLREDEAELRRYKSAAGCGCSLSTVLLLTVIALLLFIWLR